YTYDQRDRLTRAWTSGNPANAYDETYAYDVLGRLTSKAGVAYSYPAVGQPRPHAPVSVGGQAYVWDAVGTLTSGGGRTLSWDAAQRPTSITSGGVTETYAYDADGTRARRTVGGVTTAYVGDDDEVDAPGGAWRVSYRVGGQVVAQRTSAGVVTYLHGDHLGSVSAATSSSGAVVNVQTYTPWGEVRTGDIPQTTRDFTGQRRDGTGLLFYQARYYDPGLGLFLSPDPAAPGRSRPQTLNRFGYGLNNPLRYTDPDGLTALADCQTNCTVDDFDTASWQERLDWIDWLDDAFSLQGWFNNVKGIIRYFADSPTFRDSQRMSLADAGVLHAIQEGLAGSIVLRSRPDGFGAAVAEAAGHWSSFFNKLLKPGESAPGAELRQAWGTAEQAGVNYGMRLAERIPYKDRQEQLLTESFVAMGNVYRTAVANDASIPMIAPGPRGYPMVRQWKVDPRKDELAVYVYATLIEVGVTATVAAAG
ncbi:MAG: RHS repeat-associated core domain-containing protein, partial [Chloroflexi bacterium]|nr:RHS repeat-associated core domain-containing protein [Chloroflexota bacterium]